MPPHSIRRVLRYSAVSAVALLLTGAVAWAETPHLEDDPNWRIILRQMELGEQHDVQVLVERPPSLVDLETPAQRQAVYRKVAHALAGRSPDTQQYAVLKYGDIESLPALREAVFAPQAPPATDPPSHGQTRAQHALNLLRDIGHDDAIRVLVRAAREHPELNARRTAARFLAWSDHPLGLEPLRELLRDPDLEIAVCAVKGLRYLNDKPSFDRISGLLQDDRWVRLRLGSLAEALWRLDAARAPGVLANAAKAAQDEFSHAQLERYAAASPLQEGGLAFGDQELTPRQRAVRRLARSATTIAHESFGPEQYAVLMKHAGDTESIVAADCIRALGLLRHGPAAAVLIRRAGQEDRSEIYTALLRIGGHDAFACIAQQACDGAAATRMAVALGLGQPRRAAAPVTMHLLNDTSLRIEAHVMNLGPERAAWPAEHRGYRAASAAISGGSDGHQWVCHNLAAGPLRPYPDSPMKPLDINREIEHLNAWWSQHRDAFLLGQPVPPLTFYTLIYST